MIHPENLLHKWWQTRLVNRGNNFPVLMWVIFKFTAWRWTHCSQLNGDGCSPSGTFIKLHMGTALFGFGENHPGDHQNESCTVPTKISAWSMGQYSALFKIKCFNLFVESQRKQPDSKSTYKVCDGSTFASALEAGGVKKWGCAHSLVFLTFLTAKAEHERFGGQVRARNLGTLSNEHLFLFLWWTEVKCCSANLLAG